MLWEGTYLGSELTRNNVPKQASWTRCTCSFLPGSGAVSSVSLQNTGHIRRTLMRTVWVSWYHWEPVQSHPIPREEISNHHKQSWTQRCRPQVVKSLHILGGWQTCLSLFWSPQEVGQGCQDSELPHLLLEWAVGAVRTESSGEKAGLHCEWSSGTGAQPAASGGDWVVFQDCPTCNPPHPPWHGQTLLHCLCCPSNWGHV